MQDKAIIGYQQWGTETIKDTVGQWVHDYEFIELKL